MLTYQTIRNSKVVTETISVSSVTSTAIVGHTSEGTEVTLAAIYQMPIGGKLTEFNHSILHVS